MIGVAKCLPFQNPGNSYQKLLLASYQVAHRIVKCKKPHSIAKELISAAIDLASTMIKEASQKLKLVVDKLSYPHTQEYHIQYYYILV